MTSPQSSDAPISIWLYDNPPDKGGNEICGMVGLVQNPTDVVIWGNRVFLHYDEDQPGCFRYIECTFSIIPTN